MYIYLYIYACVYICVSRKYPHTLYQKQIFPHKPRTQNYLVMCHGV